MNANDWGSLATAETLQRRGDILWRIRDFFHRNGFAEVQTPTISRDTVIDRYIDPIEVNGAALACPQANAMRYFLQTSPEFGMKRLLAGGMQAIYQLGPAYRAGERGQFHNPEFTMLEWYSTGHSLDQAVSFLGDLTQTVLTTCGQKKFQHTRVISYQNAFMQTLQLDPLDATVGQLEKVAIGQGIALGSSWEGQSRDDWLNLLFAERIQPVLGTGGPQIVTHYPASQAALAQVSAEDPRTAERFELFVDGVELANGYHELLDAEELAKRSVEVLEQRRRDGKTDLSTDSRLLDAMRASMPASCGCALGIDRLVMVALQCDSIDQVIAFPIERA